MYKTSSIYVQSFTNTLIAASIEKNEKIGILSVNSKTLEPNLSKLLTECGVINNINQFLCYRL